MLNLAFVASPLDRNANNRAKPEFIMARRHAASSRIVQIAGDAVRLEGTKLFIANDAPGEEAIYLGEDEIGSAWFVRAVEANDTFKPLRSLMLEGTLPAAELSILAQARSLLHWHASHMFCAKCGARSFMSDAGYRRRCEACGADHFPRTDPVVIMAITYQGKILLGRQASWPPGMFSALAGFMEPGETIEQAVRREVLEEAGIVVGKVSYVQSQPWPFPSSLMIGMMGEAETAEIILDPAELEAARWFAKDELDVMIKRNHPDGLTASHPYAIAHHIVKAAMGM